MAEVRLNKLTKEFNVGLSTLVDALNELGADIQEMNPNIKISDEYLPALGKKFGSDIKSKMEANRQTNKINDLMKNTKKAPVETEPAEPEQEPVVIIKTAVLGEKAAPIRQEPATPKEVKIETPTLKGPVVVDTIKLEEKKPALKVTEPAEKPEVEPVKKEAAKPVVPEKDTKPQEEEKKAPEKPTEQKVNIAAPSLKGPVVVDKIDLSQFESSRSGGGKHQKRERIKGNNGPAKVDVNKLAKEQAGENKKDGKNQQQGGGKKNKKNKGNDRFRTELTEAEKEEMQKEIQRQIKETYAKMNESKAKTNLGAKHRKDKRELARDRMEEEMQETMMNQNIIKVTEFVTVNELATLMGGTPVTKVIAACMSLGLMVSINQRLDAETLVLVAEEFGYKIEFVTAEDSQSITDTEEQEMEDNTSRPPIITVMGHVDHGKTSLLDWIRKSNVIAGEAGGITQHIGAYNVELPDGRHITFLDTPGHEAFTAMRARGAKMTDLAIIIIAADDCMMPQTVEAISHAQAAGVPMIFAINKIDKPGANPDKIREQLSNMNILVEDWGGKYQCQEIAAKTGVNVDLLLEKVLLEADLLDLKANPDRHAVGTVIESSLDKGRGYLATVLVQNGTLHQGDVILSGSFCGRVKAMFNERGQKVDTAGPSTPVSVLGLNGAPTAGETFKVMEDEREAREIATKREQLLRIQGIRTQTHVTLDEIARRIALGSFKELNIIVKADVDGSIEALSDSLIKLSTDTVAVNVIHKAVGEISESDVLLAVASDAIIIGFNVRPSASARKTAEKESIDIRLYSIIYDAINEVKSGIEGMLEPEKKEEILGTAEVRETFKISKVGTIAGCMVTEGKIIAKSSVRVIRDGIVIYAGTLGSLKRFKDEAKEVIHGQDCGLSVEGYNDIKIGDVIECYTITEIKRTL